MRAYTSNAFFGTIRSFVALFVVLAGLVPLGRFLRVAVWEREAGLVSALRTAGVPRAPLIWAWPCFYAVAFSVSGILCAALLSATIFAGGSFTVLLLVFVLFGLCCTAWGLALTAVCSRAKTATLGGVISWLVLVRCICCVCILMALLLQARSRFSFLWCVWCHFLGGGKVGCKLACPDRPRTWT